MSGRFKIGCLQRANQLKQQGHTPETSTELAGIIKIFNNFQAQQAQSIMSQSHTISTISLNHWSFPQTVHNMPNNPNNPFPTGTHPLSQMAQHKHQHPHFHPSPQVTSPMPQPTLPNHQPPSLSAKSRSKPSAHRSTPSSLSRAGCLSRPISNRPFEFQTKLSSSWKNS